MAEDCYADTLTSCWHLQKYAQCTLLFGMNASSFNSFFLKKFFLKSLTSVTFKGPTPWAGLWESWRCMGLLVFNFPVQPSPPPPPHPPALHLSRRMKILLLLLPKRVRISAVENYCSCLAFRNVGAETQLIRRRRLPLLWSRRSKSARQSHGTFHSA